VTIIKSPKIDSKFTIGQVLSNTHEFGLKLIKHTTTQLTSEHMIHLNTITQNNGIKITKTTEHFIDLHGSHKGFNAIFNVTLHEYTNGTNSYHSHNQDVTVPTELDYVTDIIGFNNIPKAHTYYKMRDATRSLLTSFTPLQIANLYKYPTAYNGSGQTIGIIELGGGFNQSDLTHYWTSLGISPSAQPTITVVDVDGAKNNPADTSGDNYEVVLDIEVAGAIAPASKIIVYFGPNSDMGFYDTIYAAIYDTTHNPSIISISWGQAEPDWATTTLLSYNALFATAVSKNINVFVASGDNGSSDNNHKNNVDFPASSPNVIGCGGTTLNSNSTTITSEVVWNNNTGASGGGFSVEFAKPTYQNGIAAITTKRGVPDCAGNANPDTGYQIYLGGHTYIIGGTSCVAPLMSGLTARLNQSKGTHSPFINTALYANKPIVDITSGNNGAYNATVGWDACTGMGRVDGSKLSLL